MGKVKVIVLRSAGTNCDRETVLSFQLAGADIVDLVHINQFIHRGKKLNDYNILAIPGGFSYGDDISAGKVFANELRFKLWDRVEKFVLSGKLIIGICNGFQVLVKTGLIPDCTLSLNDSSKFECRWVYLKVEKQNNPGREIWIKDMPDIITLPVAHGEGKFVPASDRVLEDIEKNNQVLFRYTLPDKRDVIVSTKYPELNLSLRQSKIRGQGKIYYPYNPNASIANIAGITNKGGNILGIMPHPERHLFKYHHTGWTKNKSDFKNDIFGDGFKLFFNAVSYTRKHL